MSIEELLSQLGEYEARREYRDHRPEWLDTFIHQVANVFEPLTSIGRVGFECEADERGWLISMFLGTTEIIGGPRDGEIDHAGFALDVTELQKHFEQIERLEWFSVAQQDDRFREPVRSVLVVAGTISAGHNVRLELLSSPPRTIEPGLKKTET